MYVLGIDGGGTKTKGVICDEKGRVYAEAAVGPTNPNSLGYEFVEKELSRLLGDLQQRAPEKYAEIKSSFAGMSGVDREEVKSKMGQLYKKYLPGDCLLKVDNDAVNALYSGTLGQPGVVNISGTGSITFGINDEGERTRVGGWGFLLDDSGSGFSIGKHALKAIFDEYDGFGEKTVLTSAIINTLKVKRVPELIPVIYDFTKARETIASLSRLVVEAAEGGDLISQEILKQAGIEMGKNIRRLILKLFKDKAVNKELPIVLAGGNYNSAEWFIPNIKESLQFQNIKPAIILPDLPPVAGSAIASLINAGAELDKSFIDNFKNS
ncbi:Kinase similar to eukaryotic-like N- acetylglucosamine kinase [Bacillus sp. ZZV12-4809]|nr:Kinase similar to eukaryotic-like N- acetylglucosamine kinase [Bacillus sp. ZZV12-4809]